MSHVYSWTWGRSWRDRVFDVQLSFVGTMEMLPCVRLALAGKPLRILHTEPDQQALLCPSPSTLSISTITSPSLSCTLLFPIPATPAFVGVLSLFYIYSTEVTKTTI